MLTRVLRRTDADTTEVVRRLDDRGRLDNFLSVVQCSIGSGTITPRIATDGGVTVPADIYVAASTCRSLRGIRWSWGMSTRRRHLQRTDGSVVQPEKCSPVRSRLPRVGDEVGGEPCGVDRVRAEDVGDRLDAERAAVVDHPRHPPAAGEQLTEPAPAVLVVGLEL